MPLIKLLVSKGTNFNMLTKQEAGDINLGSVSHFFHFGNKFLQVQKSRVTLLAFRLQVKRNQHTF